MLGVACHLCSCEHLAVRMSTGVVSGTDAEGAVWSCVVDISLEGH